MGFKNLVTEVLASEFKAFGIQETRSVGLAVQGLWLDALYILADRKVKGSAN